MFYLSSDLLPSAACKGMKDKLNHANAKHSMNPFVVGSQSASQTLVYNSRLILMRRSSLLKTPSIMHRNAQYLS